MVLFLEVFNQTKKNNQEQTTLLLSVRISIHLITQIFAFETTSGQVFHGFFIMFRWQLRLKVTLLIGCYNLGGAQNNNTGALPFPKQPQFCKFEIPNGCLSEKGLIIIIHSMHHLSLQIHKIGAAPDTLLFYQIEPGIARNSQEP